MTVFAAVQRSQDGSSAGERRGAARAQPQRQRPRPPRPVSRNGFVQGNLAILPEKLAGAFHRFCQLNPKPCPIIGMSDVGDPAIPALGLDLDIRTDVPRATGSGATARWRTSRPTSPNTGATTSSPSCSAAPISFEERCWMTGCRSVTSNATCVCQCTVNQHRLPAVGAVAARDRWWCRCARSSRRMRSARCRSPRVFRRCTARRSISVIRMRSASRISPGRIMAMRCRSPTTEIPVFWACGVTPQSVIASASCRSRSRTSPGLMLVTRSQEQAARC